MDEGELGKAEGRLHEQGEGGLVGLPRGREVGPRLDERHARTIAQIDDEWIASLRAYGL